MAAFGQTVLSLPFPGRTRSLRRRQFHIGNADKAQECGQIWRYQIVGPSLWIPPRLVITMAFLPGPGLPDRSPYSGK